MSYPNNIVNWMSPITYCRPNCNYQNIPQQPPPPPQPQPQQPTPPPQPQQPPPPPPPTQPPKSAAMPLDRHKAEQYFVRQQSPMYSDYINNYDSYNDSQNQSLNAPPPMPTLPGPPNSA